MPSKIFAIIPVQKQYSADYVCEANGIYMNSKSPSVKGALLITLALQVYSAYYTILRITMLTTYTSTVNIYRLYSNCVRANLCIEKISNNLHLYLVPTPLKGVFLSEELGLQL